MRFEQAGALLKAKKLTIACAESCTGGLLTSRLTDVAGSSEYVMGSVVSYSNDVKMKVLGVKESTLATVGAVSEDTARQMAEGVRCVIGTEVGIGVTGIAGPGGGSAEKPVGLVYIAVSVLDNETVVTKNIFIGSRAEVKKQTTEKAMDMLLECLQK